MNLFDPFNVSRYMDRIIEVAIIGGFVVFLVLGLFGCASVHMVVMRHPGTGQTVLCQFSSADDLLMERQVQACVKAYKAAGYTVAGEGD